MRICLLTLILLSAQTALTTPLPPPSFSEDIRPLLAQKCFACHGFDAEARKGKLRLDTREGALKDNAIVPGAPGASALIDRITTPDHDDLMPPAESGDPLSPAEVDLLRRWIEGGADYEAHWAFTPPERPSPPTVKQMDWVKNPIDAFVLAPLEAVGQKPSPAADRRTLARRAALDLTGLPPDPGQLHRFINDTQSGAWGRYLDHLLASPAFGERWAAVWLDLGRYADTKGYEKDNHRDVWPWRDWVIHAYNNDLPYDQFTTHQLAGDLIPDASEQTRLATTLHRNTLTNDEGGTDDEEFRVAAVKDRVDTTIKVWMGLTMECAKCHTHKYDPITLTDYYNFFDFFNQTSDSDKADDRPHLQVESPAQTKQRNELARKLTSLDDQINQLQTPKPEQLVAARLKLQADVWMQPRLESVSAEHGTTFIEQPDRSWLASKGEPKHETYTATWTSTVERLTAIALETLPDPTHPKSGVGRARNDGNFVLTGIQLSARLPDGTSRDLTLNEARADHSQPNYPVKHAIQNPGPVNQHGWAVSGGGTVLQEAHRAVFQIEEAQPLPAGTKLTLRLEQHFDFNTPGFSIGRLRIAETADKEPFRGAEAPGSVWQLLSDPKAPMTAVATNWLAGEESAAVASLQNQRAALKKQLDGMKAVKVPVMVELAADKQRTSHIHQRGNFMDKGDLVHASVPAAFHPLPEGSPTNRLGVARWLLDEQNPLTARVAMNRLWARLFGIGLVETEEDFGTQGTLPSHPELLDWLAVEFREQGWSMKTMLKTMVTSATYQQDSKASPEAIARDPRNRHLARGSRVRLDAEGVRDVSLAAAGLLSAKLGGPSVMPHQPDGIWRTTYSSRKWATSQGEDQYRRGLYTYVKRTAPYPSMLTFDGVSREICTIRRIRTNTPLQALVSMNDPVYLEAARALAEQAQSVKASPSRRIGQLWERVLLRPATDGEHARLAMLLETEEAYFKQHPEAAHAFAGEHSSPESAAMTVVAHTLLNLDEFLNRR